MNKQNTKLMHTVIMLTVLFNMIVIVGAYADWSFTIQKQADGDEDNYLLDCYLWEGSQGNDNYDDATSAWFGLESSNDAGMIFGFGKTGYDLSDSLTKYGGNVTAAKITIWLGAQAGAGEDIEAETYGIRSTGIPTEGSSTWKKSNGGAWETNGCWGTTSDMYGTKEADGVHDSTIYIGGEDAANTSYDIWLNPTNVQNGYEYWVVHASYHETGNTNCYIYLADGWGDDYTPMITVYGAEAAGGDIPSRRRRILTR